MAPSSLTVGLVPEGAPIAIAEYEPSAQLEVFVVGRDGAVYRVWRGEGGDWQGPEALTDLGFARAGAFITATYQSRDKSLDVLVVTAAGAIATISKTDNERWTAARDLTAAGDLPTNASLSVVARSSGSLLEAYYLDELGALVSVSKNQAGAWSRAQAVSPPGFGLPGAELSGAHYAPDDSVEVFTVADDGVVQTMHAASGGVWEGPRALSEPRFAPPGGTIRAVFYPPQASVEAFVVDARGALHEFWKSKTSPDWSMPTALSEPNLAVPGGGLSPVHYPPDPQLEVLLVAEDAAWRVIWKSASGGWHAPAKLLAPGITPAGAPVSLAYDVQSKTLEGVGVASDGSIELAWKQRSSSWNVN